MLADPVDNLQGRQEEHIEETLEEKFDPRDPAFYQKGIYLHVS